MEAGRFFLPPENVRKGTAGNELARTAKPLRRHTACGKLWGRAVRNTAGRGGHLRRCEKILRFEAAPAGAGAGLQARSLRSIEPGTHQAFPVNCSGTRPERLRTV